MKALKASALLSAVLILAGCSGENGSAKGSGVSTMAAALRLAPSGSGYVSFGDLAAARKADAGDDVHGPFASAYQLGAPELAVAGIGNGNGTLADLTGIDLRQVTSAVDFGEIPNEVGILYGSFDTKAIGAKLSALGYKRGDLGGGETAWILRDDHRMSSDDALSQIAILTMLNVVHLSSGRLVYGSASSDLARLSSPGSLADDARYAGLADCLGDVKAATIATDRRAWKGLFGFGASGDAHSQTQVLCVNADSDAAAHALAQEWPSYLASAPMAKTEATWASVLSGVSATYIGGAGHVVRLTAHGARADILILAEQSGDFASLFPSAGTGV